MVQLHRQSRTPPPEADPDVVMISSDDEEEGAARREDLAQFVSAWVRRRPSRSARCMIDEFVDAGWRRPS